MCHVLQANLVYSISNQCIHASLSLRSQTSRRASGVHFISSDLFNYGILQRQGNRQKHGNQFGETEENIYCLKLSSANPKAVKLTLKVQSKIATF